MNAQQALVDAEQQGLLDYYRKLLAGNTLSPSRRRMIEAELRKLESNLK